ncbi:hypothetical protein C8Q69DRAFT_446723 [Paecilomyces variotii]|uniref:Uncharacterized protein n=1 Tax=Byssochlamys spectabilis TaxID=264951 RepID=A0A443HN62_BYSSP|nr:hypothetical protein C8Q69DRAFT_446723 [Paecilomyces variotii]RWQ93221.1 hypothetical protein C8Q69DRAFT_446723 [Paecilomyces variotii]
MSRSFLTELSKVIIFISGLKKLSALYPRPRSIYTLPARAKWLLGKRRSSTAVAQRWQFPNKKNDVGHIGRIRGDWTFLLALRNKNKKNILKTSSSRCLRVVSRVRALVVTPIVVPSDASSDSNDVEELLRQLRGLLDEFRRLIVSLEAALR